MPRSPIALALLGSLIGTAAAWAQAPTPPAVQAASPPQLPASASDGTRHLETIPVTSFATVAAPGETIESGDIIRTTRYYGAWRLTCDNRLSTNKRVCAVEQDLAGPGFTMTWRIGLTAEHRPAVSIDVSRTIDADKGIVMRIGPTTTTIQFEPCGAICRAVVPFGGLIEQGVDGKSLIGFGVSVAGQGVAAAASLDGLAAALDGSANPPGLVIQDHKSGTAATAAAHQPPASAATRKKGSTVR